MLAVCEDTTAADFAHGLLGNDAGNLLAGSFKEVNEHFRGDYDETSKVTRNTIAVGFYGVHGFYGRGRSCLKLSDLSDLYSGVS